MEFIDIFGLFSSVIVAISILMKDPLKFRVFNLMGSISFVIFGLLIYQPSIWGINLFITAVDLYYIIMIIKEKKTQN